MVTVAEAREALRLRYPGEATSQWRVDVGGGAGGFNFLRRLGDAWERFEPFDGCNVVNNDTSYVFYMPPPVPGSPLVQVDKALYDDIVKFFFADAGDYKLAEAIIARLPKPPVVDPDLLAARQFCIDAFSKGDEIAAEHWRSGRNDDRQEIAAYIAGIAHACAKPDDGWIEWGGGECPVADGVTIDIKFRNGNEYPATKRAGVFRWTHDQSGTDIAAYRVV